MGVFAQAAAGNQPPAQGGVFNAALAQSQPDTAPVVPPSLGSLIAQPFKDAAGSVASAFKGGIAKVKEGLTSLPSTDTPLQRQVGAGEGALKVGAGVAQTIFSPLAPLFSPVSSAIDAAGNALADTPYMQGYGRDVSSLGNQQLPPERILSDVADASTVGQAVLAPFAAPAAASATENALNTASKVNAKVDVRAGGTATAKAAAANDASTAASVARNATDLASPTKVNTASFNKARAALAKSPETPQFLAEQGVHHSSLIDESGRYATEDTAQALRDTAAKMSTDTLRPSLHAADYSTPKTPVSAIEKEAIARAEKYPGITAGDKEAIIHNIQGETTAMSNARPNGLGLVDMHDGKITYASNGKYSPVNDATVNNKATANRILGGVLGDMVEQKAPSSVPVHDFNGYLSKYYEAADYLDTLNTRKAAVPIGKQIARKAAGLAGAVVGSHVGGGLIADFAGYSLGRAVEHALENLTGKAREAYIRNLEVTNPEAFTKVKAYLDRLTSGNTGIPRLPAASAIQLPAHDYIPAPKFTPSKSSVKSVPAQKGLPNVNKTTNKFQSTYKSTP